MLIAELVQQRREGVTHRFIVIDDQDMLLFLRQTLLVERCFTQLLLVTDFYRNADDKGAAFLISL